MKKVIIVTLVIIIGIIISGCDPVPQPVEENFNFPKEKALLISEYTLEGYNYIISKYQAKNGDVITLITLISKDINGHYQRVTYLTSIYDKNKKPLYLKTDGN